MSLSVKKIHLVCAARPNFMKIAPLYHELQKYPDLFDVKIVHTGQHYDHNMSGVFLEQLGLGEPDYHLNVGSGTQAFQTGQTMIAYETLCLETERPDLMIVVGDVNATIACTLAAKKLGVMVAHLEAGLRSLDRTMPEELNRILTDSISDILWTPSQDGDENLLKENVAAEKVSFVGNIMIDTLVMMMDKIDRSSIVEDQNLTAGHYAVATIHRPANVDDPAQFEKVLQAFALVDVPIILPIHPRTQKTLDILGADHVPQNLRLIAPQPYIDFMKLVKESSFVVTDSGGLQEETTYLNIPCFTMRPNTERPITITQGSNLLVTPDNLQDVIGQRKVGTVPPLWDGRTAARVVEDIKQRLSAQHSMAA